jgi:carbon-monoxide dehydrogenase medium subunit
MKPAPFAYTRPETLEEAVAVLFQHGDEAKVLAGGQSLIPLMNMRLARPAVLVDVTGIAELGGIMGADDLLIGATTRQSTVQASTAVAERAPLIVDALRWVAHPAIRNRGTFGGIVAHADPAAEIAAVVLALDGEIAVRGPAGQRVVSADDFFLGSYMTALDVDEVLTQIRIPAGRNGRRWAFLEIARRHGDFAIAGVATAGDFADDGRCRSARIVLFGVADHPVRAAEAERRVAGRDLSDEAVCREAAELAVSDLDPHSDMHGTAGYRKDVARALVRRALRHMSGKGNPWN